MEKTYRILKIAIVTLLFAVVLAGAYLLYNRLSGEIQLDSLATQASAETEAEKEAVPDFTVYDREGNPELSGILLRTMDQYRFRTRWRTSAENQKQGRRTHRELVMVI